MSDLIDEEDGENRAVRSFLMLYGGSSTTVKKMRSQLECSGFDGCWPKWAAKENGHLTKGGAQDWLRYLFALEPNPTPPASQPSNSDRAENAQTESGSSNELLENIDELEQEKFEEWARTCDGNCNEDDLRRKSLAAGMHYANPLVDRDFDVWLARADLDKSSNTIRNSRTVVDSAVAQPITDIRKRALALYKGPFKYECGYIMDGGRMVADDAGSQEPEKVGAAARIRGWGRIGYMPDAEALQDETGQIIAEALTTYWALLAAQEGR